MVATMIKSPSAMPPVKLLQSVPPFAKLQVVP